MRRPSPPDRERHRARAQAERLERDAVAYPEERGEILLEAAGQWAVAEEHERALAVLDDLIATGSREDAQWAAAERIQALAALGRDDEARAEMERLRRSHVDPGPAQLVAELLESQGRLEEALTWFNVACREFFDDDGADVEASTMMVRLELDGRARVRRKLGLPADELDRRTQEKRGELTALLDRFAERVGDASPVPRQHGVASFFVRSDVPAAFAKGLVHVDDPEDQDVDSYFRRVERNWRETARENGITGFTLLPTTVESLLAYAAAHDRDPADTQTRADHTEERVRAGASTIPWPPQRNQPCWCGSGRKYKKCCGAPANH